MRRSARLPLSELALRPRRALNDTLNTPAPCCRAALVRLSEALCPSSLRVPPASS